MDDVLKILIIEDDEDHAFLESDILLDELDCEVTVAVSKTDMARIDFEEQDIVFPDELPVLMTEKDAVKCQSFATEKHWSVPVDAKLDERMMPLMMRLLKKLKKDEV